MSRILNAGNVLMSYPGQGIKVYAGDYDPGFQTNCSKESLTSTIMWNLSKECMSRRKMNLKLHAH